MDQLYIKTYCTDYDLREAFKTSDTKESLSMLKHCFQQKFSNALATPDEFITDFKCGQVNGQPIRWNKHDMSKGYQNVGDKKYTFEECLLMKSIIKLDMVVFINEIPNEFSDFYMLTIGSHANNVVNYSNKDSVLELLTEEYSECIKDKKYFKALKRLFLISVLENHPSTELIELFNSDAGRLYKTIVDLNIVQLLLEQDFKTVPIQRIHSSLQAIKQFASKVATINVTFVSDILDHLCTISSHKTLIKKIEKLTEELQKTLNNNVKDLLE